MEKIQRRTVLGGVMTLGAVAGLSGVPAAASADRRPMSSTVDSTGKVVLITGTSSGFGKLTALTLARAGHHVFASMRYSRGDNEPAARELRGIAGQEGLALDVVDIDVRYDRSVEDGVRQVHRRAGHVDVLVNNAGTFYPAVLETLSIADVRALFETNLFGHLRMNRAVLPIMREQRDGLIVQITTALGRFVLPFLGGYCGAKWALEAMTETTRYEVSQFGVEVVIVEPGTYPTDLVDPNGVAYYRRYLNTLGRQDARRREEYGQLARRAETHLVEDTVADPQEIADSVLSLVDTPRGQRPVRLLGPGMTDFLGELTEAAATVQAGVMEGSGFGDLTTIPARPGARGTEQG